MPGMAGGHVYEEDAAIGVIGVAEDLSPCAVWCDVPRIEFRDTSNFARGPVEPAKLSRPHRKDKVACSA